MHCYVGNVCLQVPGTYLWPAGCKSAADLCVWGQSYQSDLTIKDRTTSVLLFHTFWGLVPSDLPSPPCTHFLIITNIFFFTTVIMEDKTIRINSKKNQNSECLLLSLYHKNTTKYACSSCKVPTIKTRVPRLHSHHSCNKSYRIWIKV